jgi:EAL domain-containing protein (putative c-di-GMP-specific phosphodiesterase class I)
MTNRVFEIGPNRVRCEVDDGTILFINCPPDHLDQALIKEFVDEYRNREGNQHYKVIIEFTEWFELEQHDKDLLKNTFNTHESFYDGCRIEIFPIV